MIFFRKYSSIKNFLIRYTIFKFGNLHIRLHKIVDKDRTNLLHNHPFNYISIILKNGYTEIYNENGVEKMVARKFLSVIKRKHDVYHRIESIKGETITLIICYGRYNWNAKSLLNTNDDGLYKRNINGEIKWCKKENGVWFIGNSDINLAKNETRHSIHQIIKKI